MWSSSFFFSLPPGFSLLFASRWCVKPFSLLVVKWKILILFFNPRYNKFFVDIRKEREVKDVRHGSWTKSMDRTWYVTHFSICSAFLNRVTFKKVSKSKPHWRKERKSRSLFYFLFWKRRSRRAEQLDHYYFLFIIKAAATHGPSPRSVD